MKKIIVESQNPQNYGHELHEKVTKEWKEQTSYDIQGMEKAQVNN